MAEPAGRIDSAGIWVPAACDQPVDVLFDGVRVFTAAPARARTTEDGLRTLRWPRVLQPHLHGRTDITVRDHVTGRVWVQQEVAFDEAEERLAIVDSDGFPLAVDKWGFLVRTFGSTDESLAPRLLDDLDQLLTTLRDGFGVPAFLAYGTLLGAVRDGSFIGHDNDADISYVSRFENPADVARESFALQRHLVESGWRVHRSTAGFLQVWRDDTAEEQRKIDIFAGYFCGDHFAVERWVRAPMSRTTMLPLGQVSLEGRLLPAPANPEVLLAATYGPGWRVPDPAFAFHVPASTSARSDGWFGEAWLDRWRWNEDVQARAGEVQASSFARWVDQRIDPSAAVVDVGSGDGVDAVWLARTGRSVTGLDYAEGAVRAAREHAAGSSARFEELTLLDFRSVVIRAARIVADGMAPVLYVHRTLDALPAAGRANLWQLARIVRGQTLLEFTTPTGVDGTVQSPVPPYRYTNDADRVAAEVSDRGGRVSQREILDIDGSTVCRMVVDWPN